MSDSVIRVDGLWKQYRIGAKKEPYTTLRESLTGAALAPFRRLRSVARGQAAGGETNTFWALQDVSFDVKQGEVLGVIGRNGAGKSTLLKVLSRITEPSRGEVRLRGRVASLLEVGTGFHPELSGRDNIYLNGALLGMSRAEIRRKFDEIIAFAEVDQFVDTPVKHYSSGMYVRLAFAVAAHLDVDILIVDEVLAVGDVQFQQKCLGKMGDVARSGRTVILVSHNLAVVRQMCSQTIFMDEGAIAKIGSTHSVVDAYVNVALRGQEGTVEFPDDPKKAFQLMACRTVNAAGAACSSFECSEPVYIELKCRSRQPVPGLYGYMTLVKQPEGIVVLESDTFDRPPNVLDGLAVGDHRLTIEVPSRTVGVGRYVVYLNFTSNQSAKDFNVDSPGHTVEFTLLDYESRRGNNRTGYLSNLLRWSM